MSRGERIPIAADHAGFELQKLVGHERRVEKIDQEGE
jgi:hypothetical protein